jgi:proline racemase
MAAVFDKDPDATVDVVIDDFADLLAGGDTITGHTVVVDPGLVVVESSNTTVDVTVRLSGGTVGVTYQVTARVDTAEGLVDDRSVQVRVVER